MTTVSRGRAATLLALLVTAVVTGALAGLVAGSFFWVVEQGIDLVWSDLPDRMGVDPKRSWWLFAVPIVGGALVGLGQRLLGNYPQPLDSAVATWRSGGQLEAAAAPKTAVNSVIALVAGGPIGFEAALIGLLGGTATWIGSRIRAVRRLVAQAWGAERIESLPRTVQRLPYWLAAAAGVLTYRWLPFGTPDLGFRFERFDGTIGVRDALVVFAFGAAVTVPVAWAISVVRHAEEATLFRRSPVLIGMAGGVLFASLALGNDLVLFSGQQGIQELPDAGNGALLYLTFAKWAALVIALYAGWRGGPIFPTYTAVAALAVLVDEVIGIGPDLLMVGGITAASIVFVRGSLPLAFVLTLYPVPLSYTVVIVIGCLGAAAALGIAGSLGVVPSSDDEAPGDDPQEPPVSPPRVEPDR